MNIKKNDMLVLIAYLMKGSDVMTYAEMAQKLFLSQSQVFTSVKNLEMSKLMYPDTRKPINYALKEFVVHAVKYIFPAQMGARSRGMPTAYSCESLGVNVYSKYSLVWPHQDGKVVGDSIEPLHKNIINIASKDEYFYKCFSLIDLFRVGRSRERESGIELLNELLDE